MPVIFLVAGEASGDLLGARLMRALRRELNGRVRFTGVGGPQMIAEGLNLLFPHTELMHFGVVEVLRHIPRLLSRIQETAEAVRRENADILVTIDSPDFCFRVAKRVRGQKGRKIPLVHYVAPTVWAWRPGRAKKIAQFLDHLLALFPFEPPYFTKENLDCTFVGHPIIEPGQTATAGQGSNAVFRSARGIAVETPLLTVLFGSRGGEFASLAPIYRETVALLKAKHPDLQLLFPVVPHLKDRVLAEIETWGVNAHIVEGDKDKYDAFAASRAALACSGTVALELALSKLPAVIAYRVNALTAFLYRRFIHTPYANLVNIMLGREAVPEFIQENCTPVKLAAAVDGLLSDEALRQRQIADLGAAAAWLGLGQFTPSERAAETVIKVMSKNERKPTVLQVLPALVTGGVERGTVEVAAALVKAGFRALVASAGGPMAAEVEAVGGTHITLPLSTKKPWVIWANGTRLKKVIAEYNVDLVHVRSRAPAWSAWLAAKACSTTFVTTFHNAYGATWWGKRLYNSAMAKGQRVIAISRFVGDYAAGVYGVSRDILRVIPRGVDIAAFDRDKVEAGRVESLRGLWNIPAGVKVLLLPGRLSRWKGQEVLVEALARLKRRDFMAVIVGGGKGSAFGQELAALIGAKALAQNVAIFDTCRDMPAAYVLADLVLVPSTRPEGFGRVVIEAQAMGAPVIASAHGGAMETVIPGQTGWLVKPGDAGDLAAAIDAALNRTDYERRAMSDKSTAHIREHFTTAMMTGRTLDVYRELL